MRKIVINPFLVFLMTIIGTLAIYSLSWSEIYPALTSTSLILFLGITIIVLLFFSKVYNIFFPVGVFQNRKHSINMSIWVVLGFLSIAAELIYEKAIPILEVLVFRSGYNYVDFEGIPTFHVFAVTYASFLGLWLWDRFLMDHQFLNLLGSLFFVSYPLILFNRGGFIMNLCTLLFITLIRKRHTVFSVKKIIVAMSSVLVILYLFGLLGNFRSPDSTSVKESGEARSSLILNSGRATEEFKESIIPKEFFWTYLYAGTPLGNLNHMMEVMEPTNDLNAFVASSILPDFISKRIIESKNIYIPDDALVLATFNVSTLFATAFKTLGILGMSLLVLYYSLVVFGYSYLMKKMDTVSVVGIAILFTIIIFSFFNNMLTFSGLSFQLIYPILFGIYNKMRG